MPLDGRGMLNCCSGAICFTLSAPRIADTQTWLSMLLVTPSCYPPSIAVMYVTTGSLSSRCASYTCIP